MKSRTLCVFLLVACGVFAQTKFNSTASNTFGQTGANPLPSGSPNLVQGREFYLPQSLAFDTTTATPIVYVVDTLNNRVLAWKNPASVAKGAFADLVIGQNNRNETRTGGPTTAQTTGLSLPTSVAVDSSGNVYVADSGNNRILRFPKPFAQTAGFLTPDLVIGQHSYSSGNTANEGAAIPSAKTLYLSATIASNLPPASGMTVDQSGNLWVTDPGNNRVIRFPASQLATGTVEPAADLVLGQTTFASKTVTDPNAGLARLNKNATVVPISLAFDSSGNLYVSDSRLRVLFFQAPISSNGQAATRIIGVPTPTTADPNPRALNGCPTTAPFPCESALGTSTGYPPFGVAVLNNSLYVADTFNNRIVKYDVPANWPTECVYTGATVCTTGSISPAGSQFIGQTDGESTKANQGVQPSSGTVAAPVGIGFLGTTLWVADSGNNRVTAWPQSSGLYSSATAILGQLDYSYNAPNLVEGRELFMYDPASTHTISGYSTSTAGGVAIDKSSNPPHLYIADTFNHRVLGFKDARKVKPGVAADIVIGQLDLYSSSINYQSHDAAGPGDLGLNNPVGLLVDSAGSLYVADSGNGRVLRYASPFSQTGSIAPNLVLGQSSLFSRVIDPTPVNMRAPWGLAFTQGGHLLVSDLALNRVLLFTKPNGGDFTNGQQASLVVGQPDLFSSSTGTTANRFNAPRGIATDSSDRLYVADTGNNRISIFSNVTQGGSYPSPRATPAISSPVNVVVSPTTGYAWVTDTYYGRLLRYPIYEDWAASITTSLPGGSPIDALTTTATVDTGFSSFPLAVTLDADDNPIVAESNNQIAFYYSQAQFRNLFSYATRGLTPGMLAYVFRYQGPPLISGLTTVNANVPLPTTLSDIQVLVNGQAAPIFQVTANYVSFQVPWEVATSGTADVRVIRASTQAILTAASFPLHLADPGLAAVNGAGYGQLAVLNQDNTVNSASNPAARGSVIQLFGTGIGPISGNPADGQNASGLAPAAGVPRVASVPGNVWDSSNISYFGLVSWFPGVFQLNVKIPDAVSPSNTVQLGIVYQDYLSTDGPLDSSGNTTRVVTTIAVK